MPLLLLDVSVGTVVFLASLTMVCLVGSLVVLVCARKGPTDVDPYAVPENVRNLQRHGGGVQATVSLAHIAPTAASHHSSSDASAVSGEPSRRSRRHTARSPTPHARRSRKATQRNADLAPPSSTTPHSSSMSISPANHPTPDPLHSSAASSGSRTRRSRKGTTGTRPSNRDRVRSPVVYEQLPPSAIVDLTSSLLRSSAGSTANIVVPKVVKATPTAPPAPPAPLPAATAGPAEYVNIVDAKGSIGAVLPGVGSPPVAVPASRQTLGARRGTRALAVTSAALAQIDEDAESDDDDVDSSGESTDYEPLPSEEEYVHMDGSVDLRQFSWYHGTISSAKAASTLTPHGAGAYLVRPSSSEPGCFVVSYVVDSGAVAHTLLRPAVRGRQLVWKADNSDHYFVSIADVFTSEYGQVYTTPVARPGNLTSSAASYF
mmetsp:Transcript_13053/g.41171  ORF Transcript_13053/g.41171 Transcript_13053/m.41171 type:complete len:432 (-) Transcript_13053:44-1339(-)